MPRAVIDGSLIEDEKVITPADGAANSLFGNHYANAVWVGVGGDVTVLRADGSSLQKKNLIAGTYHNWAPFRNIQATGTTATDIVVGKTF